MEGKSCSSILKVCTFPIVTPGHRAARFSNYMPESFGKSNREQPNNWLNPCNQVQGQDFREGNALLPNIYVAEARAKPGKLGTTSTND